MNRAFSFKFTTILFCTKHPKENTDMSMMTTKNFLSIIDQEDKPLESADKNKIELKLIDNRTLSPIDTLGGA